MGMREPAYQALGDTLGPPSWPHLYTLQVTYPRAWPLYFPIHARANRTLAFSARICTLV